MTGEAKPKETQTSAPESTQENTTQTNSQAEQTSDGVDTFDDEWIEVRDGMREFKAWLTEQRLTSISQTEQTTNPAETEIEVTPQAKPQTRKGRISFRLGKREQAK